MGELRYTLERLATDVGMTTRNVRAYQTRGLLPRPARDGRSAVYDARHLTRLHQIQRLRAAGVGLGQILEAVLRGESLGEDGPLHAWVARRPGQQGHRRIDLTGRGDGSPSDPAQERVIDLAVLERAEQAVPGITDRLRQLRLLRTEQHGPAASGHIVNLLAGLSPQPDRAQVDHARVLEVISGAARLSTALRRVLRVPSPAVGPDGGPGGPDGEALARSELARIAAAVVHACLLRPDD